MFVYYLLFLFVVSLTPFKMHENNEVTHANISMLERFVRLQFEIELHCLKLTTFIMHLILIYIQKTTPDVCPIS